jgi:hypothetical protein
MDKYIDRSLVESSVPEASEIVLDTVNIKATTTDVYNCGIFLYRYNGITTLILMNCSIASFVFGEHEFEVGFSVIHLGLYGTTIRVANCSFERMSTDSNQSIILCAVSTIPTSHVISFENSSFTDLRTSYVSAEVGGEAGTVMTFRTTNTSVVNLVDCKFLNITSCRSQDGGCIYFGGISLLIFTCHGCSFVNSSGAFSGGAICCNVISDNDLVISNSTFRNCSAVYGGAIYIMGSAFMLRNVMFIENKDNIHGNDIYDNVSIHSNFYSPLTVINTCSMSLTPKFTVVGDNVGFYDELFELLCDYNIYYLSQMGYDTSECRSSSAPCLSVDKVFQNEEYIYSINILSDAIYTPLPINISTRSLHLFSSTVDSPDMFTSVCYMSSPSSFSSPSPSLLQLSTGTLSLSLLTFIFNSSVIGPYVSVTEGGMLDVENVMLTGGEVDGNSGKMNYSFAILGIGTYAEFVQVC